MRIAITADLHWGQRREGDEATRALVESLRDRPPDLLLLGGDLGTQNHFRACLDLFRGFTCPKALVPGNHDIWVTENDARGDSLQVYEQYLPTICAETGFQYLDHAPLFLPDAGLAVVGSINWYDYSWSLAKIQEMTADWEHRLRHKVFSRGRHNDTRFVRWPLDDVRFTQRVVEQMARHLESATRQAERVIVLTHHPAVYALNFPRDGPPTTLDGFLWDAIAGNALMERLLEKHQDRLAFLFSGHTHRERASRFGEVPAHNIGGDYSFKRLLLVDWPSGSVEVAEFGERT
ncbi:MAG: metallophosphoesterase [Gemmataceae bacterium]|nr:metallophosphoesterase [Gemmataceae bacterium]MCI0743735.1 metallophosphoesterase [Gemmataceae bacterium]